MNLTCLIDISDVFAIRMKSIEAYSTQFFSSPGEDEPQTYISTPDFLDSVIARARMLGKRIGVKYAEGFITEKKIGIRSLDSLIRLRPKVLHLTRIIPQITILTGDPVRF
jgi:hypothetical protein